MELINRNKCMCLALIIFMLGAWCSEATSRSLQDASMYARYEQWIAHHGRVYSHVDEKENRFKVYKANVAFIERSNRDATKPYKLTVNQFTDLTNEEFKAMRTGLKGQEYFTKTTSLSSFKYENVTAVPTTMDWRLKGAVTPIKDQAKCGCCWAFSAVAAMEGVTQLKTGKLISLSEQEIVDCAIYGESQGCSGGWMNDAFQFTIQNHGLATEANYPYIGVGGTCNAMKKASYAASITGFENVPKNSESALLKAVAMQPVSVAIDADGPTFQFYSSGVYTGTCGTSLNHAVTAVGYGVTTDGTKYWLVKNSWGTQWGDNGYIKMQRDVPAAEGLCGIAMVASYPTA